MDIKTFRTIPVEKQGATVLELKDTHRASLMRRLKNKEIIELLRFLDPDEAAEIIWKVPPRRRAAVVRELSADMKAKAARLLSFHPHLAGGLMDFNYIQVPKSATFGEVFEDLKRHERLTGKFPVILALEDGKLVGELHGHELVVHSREEKIAPVLTEPKTVYYDLPEREALKFIKSQPHTRIVVLDKDGSIMGVLFTDDIMQIIRSRAGHSLYAFAGVQEEEDVHDPVRAKVRSRAKWLVINLGTGFLAAAVVGFFSDTISKTVLLAAYMPIVAGMGGNAATQTLAVMVRGLALKEVELSTGLPVIFSEIRAGFVNGAINGVIVAVIAGVFNQSPVLGLVTGTAMVFNLMVAGCFGALVPMVMQKLGKDPATSATIFITTFTDVLGFFAFLGLASVLL
jgi:magnesium transporter